MIEIDANQPTPASCENCGEALNGQFCSVCGQEITSHIRYFGSVLLHLLDDIFSFDSRASRTLIPLLFKPAFLTKEYFAGKRVHYVPPLKLYIFISIIFFLSLKFFAEVNSSESAVASPEVMQKNIDKKIQELTLLPKTDKTTLAIEKLNSYSEHIAQSTDKPLQNQAIKLAELEVIKINNPEEFTEDEEFRYKQYQKHIEEAVKDKELGKEDERFIGISNQKDGSLAFDFLSKEMNDKLDKQVRLLEKKAENELSSGSSKLVQQAIAKLPQLMFILLPIFALLLKIMYMFSKRLYMEHLTVALHSHSFIFLVILILTLVDAGIDLTADSLPWFADLSSGLATCLLMWIPVYLFIMQKRIYKQGYFMTFIKYSVISFSYILLISFTGLIALIWGLTSL